MRHLSMKEIKLYVQEKLEYLKNYIYIITNYILKWLLLV